MRRARVIVTTGSKFGQLAAGALMAIKSSQGLQRDVGLIRPSLLPFGLPMQSLTQFSRKLIYDEEAATAVEYAIMLAVIVIASISAILTTGDVQRQLFQDTANDLNTFMNPTN